MCFKVDGDAENDSAVANKRQKYEGGAKGKEKGEEERRDVSGDDSVENGGEREEGKGEQNIFKTNTERKG